MKVQIINVKYGGDTISIDPMIIRKIMNNLSSTMPINYTTTDEFIKRHHILILTREQIVQITFHFLNIHMNNIQ